MANPKESKILSSHANRITTYYDRERRYSEGPLRGNRHFGYTPENKKPFNLGEAQHNMQRLLGETLDLPRGSKVLEAGCGSGPVMRTLTNEFGLKVAGIDLSQNHLIGAKELNRNSNITANCLVGADYHKMPFASDTFDGIYTIEALVHAYKLELVLNEFWRILKPGGTLVLFEYSIPDLKQVNPLVRKVAYRVIERTVMTSLPRLVHESYPRILEEAGFIHEQSIDISEQVWPTWKFLWLDSFKNIAHQVYDGEFKLRNIQGTAMIYPARRHLGYIVSKAHKPTT